MQLCLGNVKKNKTKNPVFYSSIVQNNITQNIIFNVEFLSI